MVLIFTLTVVVFVLLYVGPYRNPGWLSPGFAGALMLFGIAAFSTGEFIREAVRKPYVLYNVVLSNQIFPHEVEKLRQTGYLEGGVWTKAFVVDLVRKRAEQSANYPAVLVEGHIDSHELLKLPAEDRKNLGAVLFQYHCNDCHALEQGYSAVGAAVARP